jgi:hypothetical protein
MAEQPVDGPEIDERVGSGEGLAQQVGTSSRVASAARTRKKKNAAPPA